MSTTLQHDSDEGDDRSEEEGGATVYDIGDVTKGDASETATDPDGCERLPGSERENVVLILSKEEDKEDVPDSKYDLNMVVLK